MARRPDRKDRGDSLNRRTKAGVDQKDTGFIDSFLDLSKTDKKINWFSPKTGRDKNCIDIIPFEVTQPWYKDLRTYTGKRAGAPTDIDVGELDYKLEVPIHVRVGPSEAKVICLKEAFGKKCPICEDITAEYEKDEPDKKLIGQLRAKWRTVYCIYDYDDKDKDIQLFDISWHLFEKFLLEEAKLSDEGFISFSHLKNGKSIEFKGREEEAVIEGKKVDFTKCDSFEFIDRDPYDDDIIDDTFPLDAMLTIPTYEQVLALYTGEEEPENEEDQHKGRTRERSRKESEEEKSGRSRGRSREKKEDVGGKTEEPCPHGGKFGFDCNELEACQECDEELFDKCADYQEEIEKAKENNGKKTRTRGRR